MYSLLLKYEMQAFHVFRLIDSATGVSIHNLPTSNTQQFDAAKCDSM